MVHILLFPNTLSGFLNTTSFLLINSGPQQPKPQIPELTAEHYYKRDAKSTTSSIKKNPITSTRAVTILQHSALLDPPKKDPDKHRKLSAPFLSYKNPSPPPDESKEIKEILKHQKSKRPPVPSSSQLVGGKNRLRSIKKQHSPKEEKDSSKKKDTLLVSTRSNKAAILERIKSFEISNTAKYDEKKALKDTAQRITESLINAPDEEKLPSYYKELETKIDPSTYVKLFKIAKLISKQHELEEVVSVMQKEAKDFFKADWVNVALVKTDGLVLGGQKTPLGQGLVGSVTRSAEILNVSNCVNDFRYSAQVDEIGSSNYFGKPYHMILIPMVSQNHVVLVIQALKVDPRSPPFRDSDGMAILSLGEFIGNLIKNAQLLEKTARANKRAEWLLDISKALMSEHDIDILVSIIISEAPDLLDCARATLFLVDKEKQELIIKRGASFGRRQPDEKDNSNLSTLPFKRGTAEIRLPMTRGIAVYVAKTSETLNIPDVYADPRFSPDMDKKTGSLTRNILCVPLLEHNNEVVGVLQALNKRPDAGPFDHDDEMILKMLAAEAAIAMRNCNLFEATNNAYLQSEALLQVTSAISKDLDIINLSSIIVTKVQSLLKAERCTLFLVDKERMELWSASRMSYGMGQPLPTKDDLDHVIRFPMDRGLAAACVTDGATLRIADAYQDPRFNQSFDKATGFRTRSVLCVPLKDSKNEVLGVIQVLNKKSGDFTDNDISLIEAFSSQASVAVGNSRLYHETKRALNASLREQRNMHFKLDLTRNLVSNMSVQNYVTHIESLCCTNLNASFCRCFLLNRENGEVSLFVDGQIHHYPSAGFAGAICSSGTPILIPNKVTADVHYDPILDARPGRLTLSATGLPLLIDKSFVCTSEYVKVEEDESIIGALVAYMDRPVDEKVDVNEFSADSMKSLSSFSSVAALYLRNALQVARINSGDSEASSTHDDSFIRYLTDKFGMDLGTDNIKSFQFKMSEIKLIESIGQGVTGEVFKAMLGNRVVAVKMMNAKGMKAEHIDAFSAEASLMCALSHKNLVKFIGAIPELPHLCIITEYCALGSLSDNLLNESNQMDLKFKLNLLIQAASGMHYMHSYNPVIFHRDLKSDNLLIDADWNVKVADFGLSRFASRGQKNMTQVGTPCWMAPEVIIGETYNEKSDVYSFGIILWEVMTRMEVYPGKEAMQIILEVVNDNLRPNIPDEFLDCPLVPLMTDCWDPHPNNRPTFEVVLERLNRIKIEEEKAELEAANISS